MRYLILSQSEVTAHALGAWFELCGEPGIESPEEDSRCFIVQGILATDNGPATFGRVADWIQGHLEEAPHVPLTVLVDSVRPDSMSPIRSGWDGLIAMLALALPEVRWVFGVMQKPNDKQEGDEWICSHGLASLVGSPWRSPLFDPTGLRDYVRDKAKEDMGTVEHPTPRRERKAAVIDEENDYALFHGYTAYRFGYRAEMVTSWALMARLFGPSVDEMTSGPLAKETSKPHDYNLLLEDMNLNFPDGDARRHLSHFDIEEQATGEKGRAHHCRKLDSSNQELEDSKFRIIITSGCFGSDRKVRATNREYLEKHKRGRFEIVPKPTGGIFDLWRKARMPWRLAEGKDGVARDGLAPGYVWPPPPPQSNSPGKPYSHSAPGRLMLIASHLIRRADALRASANTPEECIRGALLATEALELLAYKTPTLSLQALELKHWFEAKAEVAFLGVGHHFELRQRFKDIERETKASTHFMPGKRGEMAALDASVSILNRLVLIYREAGQFDEEEDCLKKLRWLNRCLAFRRGKNLGDLCANCVFAYAEWLVSSLLVLFFSLLGWIVLLFLLWWAFDPESWPKALAGTVGAFVGSSVSGVGGQTEAANPAIIAISTAAALLGFFHLGVFVSFLYSKIIRK